MKIIAKPGFAVDKNICWPKDSPIRECSDAEIKRIKKVPQALIIFTDKEGNVINKKEARHASNNRKKRPSPRTEGR